MKSSQFNNVIKTIQPYRWAGGWVFDDESAGLDKEAFVAGADVMCDMMSGGMDSFTMQFSDIQFPTAKFNVKYLSGTVEKGTYYIESETGQQLWLCPALGRYFESSPNQIWVNYF